QQELNNFRMKIATYQYLRGGPNELHVIRWDVSLNINHTLWQFQRSEVGEKTGESLSRRQGGDRSRLGVPQQSDLLITLPLLRPLQDLRDILVTECHHTYYHSGCASIARVFVSLQNYECCPGARPRAQQNPTGP